MADVVDKAQELAELERTRIVAARATVMETAGDGTCRDCGEDIEPGRIAALGAPVRCSFCAGERERQARRGAR